MQQNDCGTVPPTGWRCSTADRMLCIRGKRKKTARKYIFSAVLFCVFIVPVGFVAFVLSGSVRWPTDSLVGSVSCRLFTFRAESICSPTVPLRLPGAGRNSLPWGTGDEQSPASFSFSGGNCLSINRTSSPTGSRGNAPDVSRETKNMPGWLEKSQGTFDPVTNKGASGIRMLLCLYGCTNAMHRNGAYNCALMK